jgi:hypothetical protein
MEGKKKAGAAVVTEAAMQAVLRRGNAPSLSADEDQVLRMRLGASLPSGERLERVGRGMSDIEIELLSYEIEAFLELRRRGEQPLSRRAVPAPSRAKEKIIRALRRKI